VPLDDPMRDTVAVEHLARLVYERDPVDNEDRPPPLQVRLSNDVGGDHRLARAGRRAQHLTDDTALDVRAQLRDRPLLVVAELYGRGFDLSLLSRKQVDAGHHPARSSRSRIAASISVFVSTPSSFRSFPRM